MRALDLKTAKIVVELAVQGGQVALLFLKMKVIRVGGGAVKRLQPQKLYNLTIYWYKGHIFVAF